MLVIILIEGVHTRKFWISLTEESFSPKWNCECAKNQINYLFHRLQMILCVWKKAWGLFLTLFSTCFQLLFHFDGSFSFHISSLASMECKFFAICAVTARPREFANKIKWVRATKQNPRKEHAMIIELNQADDENWIERATLFNKLLERTQPRISPRGEGQNWLRCGFAFVLVSPRPLAEQQQQNVSFCLAWLLAHIFLRWDNCVHQS